MNKEFIKISVQNVKEVEKERAQDISRDGIKR